MELAEARIIEPNEAANMDPPCYFDKISDDEFCMIMKLLEVWEQIKLRRVCHDWQHKIEGLLMQSIRCLKLNVKRVFVDKLHWLERDQRIVQFWAPDMSLRQMQFEFAYQAPEIDSSKQVQITIRDRAFSLKVAQALGRLFSRIQTLLVYWDAIDYDHSIDSLVVLLKQIQPKPPSPDCGVCTGLTTFGLIVSDSMGNPVALPKICAAINAHRKPLEQLHLMVPDYIEYGKFHESFQLLKTAEMVTRSFSMTGMWENFINDADKLGASSATPLESLSLHSTIAFFAIGEQRSTVPKDRFVSVKRLQLTSISRLEDVQKLVEYFPNVEQLHLTYRQEEARKETFGFKWIRALKPLTKLTELTLLDFNLDYLTLRIATGNVAHFECLSQLRTLTMASPDLFYKFRLANSVPFFPGLHARHIAHTIGNQFPHLVELNLLSGDSNLHNSDQQPWQALEQNIGEQLPKMLCQMTQQTGLRVSVQLGHPVMSNMYMSKRVYKSHTAALIKFDSMRRYICDELLRSSRHNDDDDDDDFLIRLLSGDFGERLEEVDRRIIERFTREAIVYERRWRVANEV